MMFRGRVAAVSYLNTVPFIYGISHAADLRAELILSPPSRCAELFRNGEADVALLPAGALPDIGEHRIVSSYCIGAVNPVRTVVLMSDGDLSGIRTVYLDHHSITSALLVKILCNEFRGIYPRWEPLTDYSIIPERKPGDGFLLIGDKVFDYENSFGYRYDLAQAWEGHTGLPFVFAVWVAREHVPEEFISGLDNALRYGTRHIGQAIDFYGHSGKPYALQYLTSNIDYDFDYKKREALRLYSQLCEKYRQKVNPG